MIRVGAIDVEVIDVEDVLPAALRTVLAMLQPRAELGAADMTAECRTAESPVGGLLSVLTLHTVDSRRCAVRVLEHLPLGH